MPPCSGVESLACVVKVMSFGEPDALPAPPGRWWEPLGAWELAGLLDSMSPPLLRHRPKKRR